MHTYQLKENGAILAEGTLLDCWKSLIEKYGHLTVADLAFRQIIIE